MVLVYIQSSHVIRICSNLLGSNCYIVAHIIDIFAATETFLDSSIPDGEFVPYGFAVF